MRSAGTAPKNWADYPNVANVSASTRGPYYPRSTAHSREYPLLRDRAWLDQQYSREFRSIAEIATMVGVWL